TGSNGRAAPGQPSNGTRPRPPGPAGSGDQGQRPFWNLMSRRWLFILGALLIANLVATSFFSNEPTQNRNQVAYSFFKDQVEAGNVQDVTTRGDIVQGTFKRAVAPPRDPNSTSTREPRASELFSTQLPPWVLQTNALEQLLEQHNVTVSARPIDTGRNMWLSILISFGPGLLFFGLLFWMSARAQQAQRGIFGIGRSRARRYDENASNQARITFADVAGIEEAKFELEEIVDFLKNPEKYQRLGGSIPKGVLLVGPPGTGKTLLAKAVAGEAGVPFFSLSGSEFVEMIVGVGAARVRDLFSNAKKEAPAIIFIDELDAIGRRRGGIGFGGANQEQEQTLNQILTEMDGFDARQAVIVIAATNRPDVLDPALLRPGRFDRRVTVQRPDRVGREAILRVHTRGVPLDKDVDLADMAAATPGLVGAELRNVVNEAALLAARKDRNAVTMDDFFSAMEKIVLGAERKLVMSEEDRKRVAYHESGHALMGLLAPDTDPVHKVTIVPRGQALGVTYQVPLDDRHNYGERYLRGRITGALGGRAAEELIFGAVSTGAENDLRQATQIARQMVTRWGMSEKIGLVYTASPDDGFLGDGVFMPQMGREVSENTSRLVDEETKRIIDECYELAQETLAHEKHRLVALAETLLKQESLDEKQIREVTGLTTVKTDTPAPDSAEGIAEAVHGAAHTTEPPDDAGTVAPGSPEGALTPSAAA
ncbi:MAG TPA: ATP-dependent zinc metalloprotease FtsH, partial [Chloroflexota bacterium]|nr:ATP-dependent zinc metalloprotease FtsH [Chloroflexota bacterium]